MISLFRISWMILFVAIILSTIISIKGPWEQKDLPKAKENDISFVPHFTCSYSVLQYTERQVRVEIKANDRVFYPTCVCEYMLNDKPSTPKDIAHYMAMHHCTYFKYTWGSLIPDKLKVYGPDEYSSYMNQHALFNEPR